MLANLSSALSILHISYNIISGIIFFAYVLYHYIFVALKLNPLNPHVLFHTYISIIPVSGTDRKVGLGQEQETETGIVASCYSVATF